MPDEYDEKYYFEILSILEEKTQPFGSGLLSQLLREKGYGLSEATVGRVLSSMDRQGLTKKLNFQGRTITDKGRSRLEQMRGQYRRLADGNRFVETLGSRKKEDLLDVLVARKAIEREVARLAAVNASEEDIRRMKGILREQQEYSEEQKLSAEHDTKFHKLLGEAAGNKVLAVAMDVIRHDAQLSPILEYIRCQVGGKLVVDHAEIVKAIEAHDPDRAEQAMIHHVQGLIDDVGKYWSRLT
ncbi:putative L-lactate dehydrogenase operon regulatory protein [Peptococcaceae bacterium CEB3]|nr:putative L-lactate dehydrogenase operon regulatory protein [Peptococcaceae bacterium CEB3]